MLECPNASAVAAVAAIISATTITTDTFISPPVAHLCPVISYFRTVDPIFGCCEQPYCKCPTISNSSGETRVRTAVFRLSEPPILAYPDSIPYNLPLPTLKFP